MTERHVFVVRDLPRTTTHRLLGDVTETRNVAARRRSDIRHLVGDETLTAVLHTEELESTGLGSISALGDRHAARVRVRVVHRTCRPISDTASVDVGREGIGRAACSAGTGRGRLGSGTSNRGRDGHRARLGDTDRCRSAGNRSRGGLAAAGSAAGGAAGDD